MGNQRSSRFARMLSDMTDAELAAEIEQPQRLLLDSDMVRGKRCASRRQLEYDHVIPVARGGRATVDNIRQRCRVHNQFEAERTFGADFMRRKRGAAA